jgi:uncharacterized protein (TIGR02246 family)
MFCSPSLSVLFLAIAKCRIPIQQLQQIDSATVNRQGGRVVKRIILSFAVVAFVAGCGSSQAINQAEAKATSATAADEQAIRGVAQAFKHAFDKHDPNAIAALFLPDAKVIMEDGAVVEGQKAISDVFAKQFDEMPHATIDVTVESIRFVGSDLALEVGSTKTTVAPDEEPDISRYTVVHLKRDGKWMMALARDAEGGKPTCHEQLQPLAWLVGEWIDESPAAVVRTSCKWSDDKNFLLQHIEVKRAGKVAMTISQRIGWDSVHKCVRSWVFDSEGGFSEGLWARTDDGWLIRSTGGRSDGTAVSATNTLTRTGKDSFTWRSEDRVAGGNVEAPVEVRVTRVPPSAAAR